MSYYRTRAPRISGQDDQGLEAVGKIDRTEVSRG